MNLFVHTLHIKNETLDSTVHTIAGCTALYPASTPLCGVVERARAAVEQWPGSCGRLQHFSLCYWESLERLQAHFVSVSIKLVQ